MNISKFVFYTLTTSALFLSTPLPLKAEITVTNSTSDEIEVTFRISAKPGIRSDMPNDISFDPYSGARIHTELTRNISPGAEWNIGKEAVIPEGEDLQGYSSYFVAFETVMIKEFKEGKAGFGQPARLNHKHHFNLGEEKGKSQLAKNFTITKNPYGTRFNFLSNN
ncbi:MAG TPA: hypothetical protein VMW10_09220 [Alphaproteobacteria bacterium]|nr:hypothetical protein [Alphaproteobacteria bacterium]